MNRNKQYKRQKANNTNLATFKLNQKILLSVICNTKLGHSIILVCDSACESMNLLLKDKTLYDESYNLTKCLLSLMVSKETISTKYLEKELNTLEFKNILKYVDNFIILINKFIAKYRGVIYKQNRNYLANKMRKSELNEKYNNKEKDE